eukprot:11001741-Alexandrium_andersonii.AAC.1
MPRPRKSALPTSIAHDEFRRASCASPIGATSVHVAQRSHELRSAMAHLPGSLAWGWAARMAAPRGRPNGETRKSKGA